MDFYQPGSEVVEKFNNAANYAVLLALFGLSGLIGVYFWRKGDQSSPEETLLGGRSLGVLPVTCSISASFMSALTLIGIPAEVYTQGTMMLAILLLTPIVCLLTGWVYLPTFHNLQLHSSYQYLELRFSPLVKGICGSVFTFSLIIYIAIVVYMPALALEQVVGLNVDLSCASMFVICVFYTSIGGMKAVVWTDVFQLFFMFFAIIILIILATAEAGGAGEVWDINYQDGRIQLFNFAMDPRERHTSWGIIFGYSFLWLSVYGVSQTQVQRYLSLPTLKKAQSAVKFNFIFSVSLTLMVGWLGMVMYAVYHKCDPITSKQVRTRDQMLPLHVLHVAGDYPGIPGLFMAGVFSGSLSTISSALNSLAAITLKDFITMEKLNKLSQIQQAFMTKVFSAIFGLIGYGVTFLIRFMPGMLEAGLIIGGVTSGPIIGVFTLGMVVPWVGEKGALGGFLTSVVISSWIAAGKTIYGSQLKYDSVTSPKFPDNIDECPSSWLTNSNSSKASNAEDDADLLPGYLPIYELSYIWYSALGFWLVIMSGLLISLVWREDVTRLDKRLLTPALESVIKSLPSFLQNKVEKYWEKVGSNKCDVLKRNGYTLTAVSETQYT